MTKTINNQTFELLPERALYWQQQNALIISDLHIGKGMHFRKAGIPIPNAVFDTDLEKLNHLITLKNPSSVIIVGDMFHSDYNNEIAVFDIWRAQYPGVSFKLVKGNHDILPRNKYKDLGIEFYDTLEIDEISFCHDCPEHFGDKYYLTGHIHPGVRISGLGRQSLRLPCFYFNHQYAILPAFGRFTGLATVNPQDGDDVFVIAEGKVMQL